MSQSACPFSSASVTEHLVRGAGAAILLALAFWLFHGVGSARMASAAASLAGAVVLMRGCPTCWTVGLVATVGALLRTRQTAGSSSEAAFVGSTRPASVPAPR